MFWSSDILVEIANAKENWAEKEGNLEKLLENNKIVRNGFTFFQCMIVSSFIT